MSHFASIIFNADMSVAGDRMVIPKNVSFNIGQQLDGRSCYVVDEEYLAVSVFGGEHDDSHLEDTVVTFHHENDTFAAILRNGHVIFVDCADNQIHKLLELLDQERRINMALSDALKNLGVKEVPFNKFKNIAII